MLVLSRHRDESIIIGDDVVITIVDIRGDKVRLGIDAPQDIPVHRREVYEAIQRENQKAAKLKPSDARTLGNGGNSIPDSAPK
jgi:carbon storage regulator